MDDRSPRLLWADDGAPRSGRFADVYFSKDDGLAESRAVFLAGAGLPDAWRARPRFSVAELGFGTGLNIVALLDLWRRDGPADGHLSIFSIEGYPLSRDEAARALAAWPEVEEAAQAVLARWPETTPGRHRIDLPGWRATLDLHIGDVVEGLDGWSGPADAWFLDGFSPALNPEMWADAVFDRIAARSAPGARVATFTVAGAVRRALEARGFDVAKRPGHGRKRERLEAVAPGLPPTTSLPPQVAIIGAGIAGASLARAFTALGVAPIVIDGAGPGAGASGFPSALVTPRLDVGDEGLARLSALALRRASRLYDALESAVIAHGVLQLEGRADEILRFAKVADQAIWSAGDMVVVPSEEASRRLGEPVGSALDMGAARVVRPAVILAAWLRGADLRKGQARRLERTDERWRVLDEQGQTLALADIVVLAGGWGNVALGPELALSPVRGQAAWVEGVKTAAVAWGGYVAPTGTGLLFGATHERGVSDDTTRAEDLGRLLDTVRARLPGLASRLEHAGVIGQRAAVRATTADRLPVAGRLEQGLYVLGALGSRGFSFAPLLAEHVAALALGAPSPLPAELAARASPDRAALQRLAQPPSTPQG